MKTLSLTASTFLAILLLTSCDRNEYQPVLADQVFHIAENSKTGTIVGKVEATDLDDQSSLSFEIIGGNTENAFSLESSSGTMKVGNPSVLDFEKIQKFNLQVVVSDNHPNEPLESEARITVQLIDMNEFAPVVEDQIFSVNERSKSGTPIGTVNASDPDGEQQFTFKIESGNEDQAVQLDTLTGEITIHDSAWFDYSVHQELICMISVCDNDSLQPLTSFALVTIDVLDVPLATVDIVGYVQKGPYILGSTITVSELNADLQPTGRVFSTQIADNSGRYELPKVELESGFLHLKAEGFYFNERSGGISEAQLTLHSLVDITNKESFNINILSHLEKDRISELMNTGMSFASAKQQAKEEILGIFGFVSVDQLLSEQMDISSTGEDNAILLATSLIIQGDRTTGEFSELLSQISLDLKSDGTIDRESIGTKLINGINYANLGNIRDNIEQRYNELTVEYEISDFEKYINQFINQTDFVATNQFIFPESGTYGTNILHESVTEVEDKSLNDRYYSMVVEVPEGRSLTIKVIHSCFYAWGSLINMTNYHEQEPIQFSSFTTTSSGLCDAKISFRYDYEIAAHNTKILEYYADGDSEPYYTKEVEVLIDHVPVDSTSFK